MRETEGNAQEGAVFHRGWRVLDGALAGLKACVQGQVWGIRAIGRKLGSLGGLALFLFRALIGVASRVRGSGSAFLTQVWRFFARPAWVMALAGFSIGVVLAFQANHFLSAWKAEENVPYMVALPLVREFAPVLSSWLFAGMLGSALTAEVGLMKVGEQLLSLELMGVDSFRWVISPRFYAVLTVLPLLMLLFIALALVGSIGACGSLGLDVHSFVSGLWEVEWYSELRGAIGKSLAFAGLIAWFCLFQGSKAPPNAEGVSQATTRGVTWSLLGILVLDLLITVLSLRARVTG